MEEKTFLSPTIKALLIFTIILLTGVLVIFVGNPPKNIFEVTLSPSPSISPMSSAAVSTPNGSGGELAGWKTHSDTINSFQFNYPPDLDIVNGDIRISVAVENTDLQSLPLKCPNWNFEGFSDEFEGSKTIINNVEYCEYGTGEGAAGTIIQYLIYTTVKDKKMYIVSTSAALKNCENYCTTDDVEKCKKQPEIISCTAENNAKLDLVKKILSTFKFIK